MTGKKDGKDVSASAETQLTVVEVEIEASEWIGIGEPGTIAMTYYPANLSVSEIQLGGSVGLYDIFDYYRGTDPLKESSDFSWGLPREMNSISLATIGKSVGKGTLEVTHPRSEAKAKIDVGVCKVEVKVQEKPWGAEEWSPPEDAYPFHEGRIQKNRRLADNEVDGGNA